MVSADGSEVHRTAAHGCNCVDGLKTLPPRPCWHRCAVVIVLGSPVSAIRARPPLALPPASAPAVPDVWAALDAVGALDLVPAF